MESEAPVKQAGNRDNLGRFAKGSSGNPLGRPRRGEAWAEIIAAAMERRRDDGEYTVRESIVRKAIELALEGFQ